MLQNRLFFALASRSGFGATISDAVARRSIVFCNSVSADRIVMAVSRLLRAVAAGMQLSAACVTHVVCEDRVAHATLAEAQRGLSD